MTLLWISLALITAEPLSSPAARDCWIRGARSRLVTRASPHDSTTLAVGSDTITVCYARVAKRGRPIMGGLVPYGEPWRLGANEATAIYVPFRSGTVPAERVDEAVEDLSLTLRREGGSGAVLEIAWENTRVRVPITRRGNEE